MTAFEALPTSPTESAFGFHRWGRNPPTRLECVDQTCTQSDAVFRSQATRDRVLHVEMTASVRHLPAVHTGSCALHEERIATWRAPRLTASHVPFSQQCPPERS